MAGRPFSSEFEDGRPFLPSVSPCERIPVTVEILLSLGELSFSSLGRGTYGSRPDEPYKGLVDR